MTTKDQQEYKKLIKEGTVEALRSIDGQSAIVDALRSPGGQDAIVNAMDSKNGQDAIKQGALSALKSNEGQEVLIDSFLGGFNEITRPILEDISDDIKELKSDVKHMSENHGVRIQRLERRVGIAI